ncbi:hypothetical protein TREMEDRAFT_62358 [Tremella mesenterica DSM 1558]|uniref:uncharacterized protein n=1 Tax=Tremella mesenterica (strain ATCC 24925 / CBS 8224 / DSM 1558 / NBRC 9311 / NRRL Y-6157 / RJB 2259-6 / UBC 559-6) TaxID=578456 RepID=UPI0003F49F26|nr:uncharacterized protein TREMEDRAFT_62358 [Tremella mesenterica DSM 1558]EIW69497.1 hypothetical protein TREMEDRAFT_62358 [Tremella mesenterica DSM 1558]
MIPLLLILPAFTGLRLTIAANSGLYISLQDENNLCLSVEGYTVELHSGHWVFGAAPSVQSKLDRHTCQSDWLRYHRPSGRQLRHISLSRMQLTRRWSWTANNDIQHYVNKDLCLQGDPASGHVIPAKCSGQSNQAWSYRFTVSVPTDGVVPIGVVYSDPQGTHRIRGRNDLCVSSEAYPGSDNYTGTLFAGLTATLAQCVPNDSPITSFQLFEPFSNGSGPIRFENSSAAFKGSSYCLDAGDSPVNGSTVLVQICKNGAVGQQWTSTNTSIALSGQNLCLQTGNEMYGGGSNEGDYTPVFVLQVFTCNNALKQQTFTTYTGENVPPPISTSRA